MAQEKRNDRNDDSQYKTIEEIMKAREAAAKEAAEEVDRMEKMERMETKDQHVAAMKGNVLNSAMKKHQFISEIKSGLGSEIKEKPTEIKHVKKKRSFKEILKSFFTKF